MPELAEVDYFRKQWNPALGRKIVEVKLHPHSRIFRGISTSAFEKALTGATLRESWSHGKQMLFHFSGGAWMGLHLGMTGKLRMERADYTPAKHDHFVLVQSRQSCVFEDPRHFGRIRFDIGPDKPDWWQKQPPSVISKEFTLELLQTFLKRRAKAPIKAVLLMQERFPGIGNWMADEILWRSRIHPRLAAGKLDALQTKELWKSLRDVSQQALRIIGKDWSDPPDSWLFNHRWSKGGDCPRCKAKLERHEIGGRTTCFCPHCQTIEK